MEPLTPCDSGSTVLNSGSCGQFNPHIVKTYLTSRSVPSAPDFELVLMYKESRFAVKLSAVASLVNSYASKPIPHSALTINHLIVYIYYFQIALLGTASKIYINQFNVLFGGRSYKFTPYQFTYTDMETEVQEITAHNQTIMLLNNISRFNMFHLIVQHNTNGNLNVYQYFNAENYLSHSLGDRPSIVSKMFGKIRPSVASAGSDRTVDTNTEKPKPTQRRRSLRRLLFR
ncbi:uncharacterized protein CANTADRAFT_334486 [Suhomyces tanzawaensis NRRL Y-17324]|uniref:Uncharacterized protein n=1 Tax=Suhomyces tanzawaensis NRRL Y-17324 TaxID=984487 RepID=A0A1E4SBH8_9ASCO|nr:uncharacterized protein CANTADRAFT_334486 [Suhomyces tanzawaensis NRRL Y-17324]ODV76835.1 hypothetical protein CANTADRAFT_334486 [Suhomyces tanzawaensis NRRL Y-17324]